VGFQVVNGDNNRIAFAREGKGFVALSRSLATNFSAVTTLPDGKYCNVAMYHYTAASGPTTPSSCSGPAIGVAGGGAVIDLPANGAVVLHIGARL
jgi:alpha-amylase